MPELTVAVRDNTRRGVASAARNLTTLKDKAQAASRSMRGLGDRTEKTGVQFAQSAMRMAGFSMALGSVGLAMRSVIKTGSDFEFTMARVGAVTGATGKDFDSLNKQAKDLGASTVFSAKEAADAMQFLGMAGMETNEIMSAMPTTLQLAAAGAMELGETADIVTNILSGMRLEISELDSVANGLAVAATSSNTSIALLGESFSYASGISASVGLTFADVAAALGKLGDAGLKGSRAGMNLSMAMAKVLDPSKEAAEVMERLQLEFMKTDGTMISLVEMIQQLERAQISAQDQFKLFGVQGGRAIAALTAAGAPALEKLRESIETNNTALDEMSDKMGQTTQNKMKALTSAVEGLQLVMFENLAPALTQTVEQLTLVARSDDAVQVMRDLGVAAGELATALIGIGKFVREYGDELMLLATLLGAGKAGSLMGKGAAMVGAGGAAAALPGVALATGVGVGGAAYARSKIDPMVAEEGAGNVFDVIGNAIRDGFNRLWHDAPEAAFTGGVPTGEEPRWALDLSEEVKRFGAMTNEAAAAMYGSPQGFGAAGMVLPKITGGPSLGGMAGFGGDLMGKSATSLMDLQPNTVKEYNKEIDLQIELLTAATDMARLMAQQELELNRARVAGEPQPHIDALKRLHDAQRKDLTAKTELAAAEDAAAVRATELEQNLRDLERGLDLAGQAVSMVAGPEAAKNMQTMVSMGTNIASQNWIGAASDGLTLLGSALDTVTKAQEQYRQAIRETNAALDAGAAQALGSAANMAGPIGEAARAAQEEVTVSMREFFNRVSWKGNESDLMRYRQFVEVLELYDQWVAKSMAGEGGTGGGAQMRLAYEGKTEALFQDSAAAQRFIFDMLGETYQAFGDWDLSNVASQMFDVADALDEVGNAAAKSAIRLEHNAQEILIRTQMSEQMRLAGSDANEQRKVYLSFQDQIASLRRSEQLAQRRGGRKSSRDDEDRSGVLETPAGKALTLSPIEPTNWNTIVDEDTLRAATPIPVVWSEILALLDRSHTRIGNARGDNLGSWDLVVDTGVLRGMDKIRVRWSEVTDLLSSPSARVGGSPYELNSWKQIVDEPSLDRMTKIRAKWSDVLGLLGRGHTRIGHPDAGDTLDKWDLVVDATNLRAMEQIKVKWSDVLELLDKGHTRIGKAKGETSLDHWNLVVDSDNLKSMNKIDVNWSDIIAPTKSNISLNSMVAFDPFNFSDNVNWNMGVLPKLRSGIKDSVEGLSVSVNLANIIRFDTADLSDAISRAVQEAIDDRQIEPISTAFAADPFGRG